MSVREHKKRQARRQWLQAARHCFARDGYEAVTIAQLAAEAGLSRPGFFLYFPSKAALRTALCLELLQAWLTVADQEQGRGGAAGAGSDRALARIHRQLQAAPELVRASGVLAAGLGEGAGESALRAAWLRLAGRLRPGPDEGLRLALAVGLLRAAWQVLLADGGADEAAEAALRQRLLAALSIA